MNRALRCRRCRGADRSGTLTHGALSCAGTTDISGGGTRGDAHLARFRCRRCATYRAKRHVATGFCVSLRCTWSDGSSPGRSSWVAFPTWRCTCSARAARLGAVPAWWMHPQVPNHTQGQAPVNSCTWSDTGTRVGSRVITVEQSAPRAPLQVPARHAVAGADAALRSCEVPEAVPPRERATACRASAAASGRVRSSRPRARRG